MQIITTKPTVGRTIKGVFLVKESPNARKKNLVLEGNFAKRITNLLGEKLRKMIGQVEICFPPS